MFAVCEKPRAETTEQSAVPDGIPSANVSALANWLYRYRGELASSHGHGYIVLHCYMMCQGTIIVPFGNLANRASYGKPTLEI